MKISFIRHGESRSNAKQILASAPDEHNGLTDKGIAQIQDAAKAITDTVTAVYASPYLRTALSANTFVDSRLEDLKVIIDKRLQEIDYGKHVDQKDHPDMEHVATLQIAGDYEIRFGETGENKREILTRFYRFLIDMLNMYPQDSHIVIFSHGRAISIIESSICHLKQIEKQRIHTDNGTIKELELNTNDIKLLEDDLKRIGKGGK